MITGAQAVNLALDWALGFDLRVLLLGLGINDESGVFGTTIGLAKKYGHRRVRDVPVSENALTGVVLGLALSGRVPILTHQRMDFSLLSADQIVNQIAKWRSMFGLQRPLPLVIRMIVGRGWGQGPQHSQFLGSLFAQVPRLTVVAPCFPDEMHGLLLGAIYSADPVVFIEHRWCHNLRGDPPREECRAYTLGPVDVRDRRGLLSYDLTIFSTSYMVAESVLAARALRASGINAFVVNVHTLRPLERNGVLTEAFLSGRVLVVDPGWGGCGFSAEILATIAEGGIRMKSPPVRLAISDSSCPTAPSLSRDYYPRAEHIYRTGMEMVGEAVDESNVPVSRHPHDQPDPSFGGPF